MNPYIVNLTEQYMNNHPIFGKVTHNAVLSSMDFGLILPPPAKEGTTQPTYPTPEVEVTSELIGVTNETTKCRKTSSH